MLFDAHCHLGWLLDPEGFALEAEALGMGVLAVTVTPAEHAELAARLAPFPAVRVAAGLHPWWLACGRCGARDVDAACEAASHTRWIGEVGLDFSPRRSDAAGNEEQVRAFTRICAEAREGAVLSIHAVRAADAALDVLERTGALGRCRCVFHWFSGSDPELARAVRAGCWFSVGERMLATRRGREYARQVPAARLLAETDLPDSPGSALCAADVAASLERALAGVASARGADASELRGLVADNARGLLGA